MKLQLWSVGKDHEPYVRPGVEDFTRRISRYFPVEWKILAAPKNAGALPEMELKKREGETILDGLQKEDWLVALDERGKPMTSEGLAELIGLRANESVKNLVFLIGGAYGLDKDVLKRANLRWSLSELTFPHQLVRLVLSEQLYRACTIIRNEKYHHS
ncbi:MAG: 23S rRNA (pseudouridine(1915)-N(3))-methyltransferase RlmH [Bacteroidota bacterium]|nr:23S rRNA (pseudouridine(1915)-N(3))-methyltransferase RlmH [Bacteroidota bacterium]MDP4217745.1 23S rRNA (pseudouridine(1915)-N(3))-methyltransferase RlmH [Bacteroidota bacterium]MDP4246034.1 23S rRNA (pseudouridine(1915)-N(3))-methyltransferase RlmH [Bacteroidota bacterium]MDP4253322.1 23S rRNA (pseudouridine(1915)-N(3))-methyltransferase RlmH [Bacteroidota bacterium]MDP4257354.1 23S rRNA (pseudouridine(1915)-N(3))-methyltransferase RlmH [Bacteroidota bacterium]